MFSFFYIYINSYINLLSFVFKIARIQKSIQGSKYKNEQKIFERRVYICIISAMITNTGQISNRISYHFSHSILRGKIFSMRCKGIE